MIEINGYLAVKDDIIDYLSANFDEEELVELIGSDPEFYLYISENCPPNEDCRNRRNPLQRPCVSIK